MAHDDLVATLGKLSAERAKILGLKCKAVADLSGAAGKAAAKTPKAQAGAEKLKAKVVDTLMKKVEKTPHGKKVKVCFGRYTDINPITAESSMTVIVPGDFALNFLKPFTDKGSKNIFRGRMMDTEADKWLLGGHVIERGNLSASSYTKVVKIKG